MRGRHAASQKRTPCSQTYDVMQVASGGNSLDIPLPVQMSLPIDELQRRAEELEHSELLDQALLSTFMQRSRFPGPEHGFAVLRQMQQHFFSCARVPHTIQAHHVVVMQEALEDACSPLMQV